MVVTNLKDSSIKNRLKAAISLIDNSVNFITVAMLALMIILIAYQFIARYILRSGSAEVDETVMILYVWFIYFGMILATKEREHIRVTMMIHKFKGKARELFYIISNTLWLYFNIYVVVVSIQLIERLSKLGTRSPVLDIFEWIIFLVLPICFLWTSIYIIRDIVQQIRKLLA